MKTKAKIHMNSGKVFSLDMEHSYSKDRLEKNIALNPDTCLSINENLFISVRNISHVEFIEDENKTE